jgi:beta-lactamase regulating signal transducer with metallopeptidase domain
MSGLSSSGVDAIGWMLLHSLWQGAAVAIALALALLFLCRAPAQARYLAACGAMALMIALPAVAVWRPRAIPSVVPAPRPIDPQPTTAEGTVSTKLDSTPAPRSWRTRIVTIFPAIIGLWMTGAGVLSLRLLAGWVLARQWVRRDARPLVCPWIDRLKERMGIRRAVALLESARVEVPMVGGWLRPAILVPVAALSGLTAPQLEAILAHELAHIRRHDYLVNLLQCVVEILMFHHPATWWITRVIRREREHCCDDMAVAASRDRLTYAQALAAMEGLRTSAFSLSPAANGGNLLARVRRILKSEEESMKPVRMLLGLVVVLAVTSIWLTRADDQMANANPRSARPPMDRPRAFPSRSFADIRRAPRPGQPAKDRGDQIDRVSHPIEQLKRKLRIDDARQELIEYYQKQGFFEVKVTPVTRPTNEGKVELTFVISEGTQYRVRNAIIEGNTKIKTTVLREGMELHSGKPFLDSVRNADKNRLLAKYYEIGCIDAEVSVQPRFTSQPGVVDLLYHISEGEPYLLGELEILKDHDFDKINDAEAEKTFSEGMYYKRIGKTASAEFYFGKILQRWPNGPSAVKSKEQLQANPKPADRTRVEFFNFLVGGFY